jgi:hypothetical protein
VKRFLTYLLFAVALYTGVTSTYIVGNQHVERMANPTETHTDFQHDATASDQHQSFFSAPDLFLTGLGSEQVRLSFSSQATSFRIIPFTDNFRISHSLQIVHQKYFCTGKLFALQLAHKQSDGYYLYHLRKLLI